MTSSFDINKLPLVSVYIPTNNRSSLLVRAIESVLQQTYENIELIIVNDNSTDNTRVTLENLQLQNGNIKILNTDKKIGACESRNMAILNSKGIFVTGLDDDDYFNDRGRIEKLVNFWFEDKKYSKKVLFDDVKVKTRFGIINRKKNNLVTINNLRTSNSIGSQIFALRETYIDCGLFDPLMPMWQDWDICYRISKMGFTFVNIQNFSYTVDKSHNFNRISKLDDNAVRTAMCRLITKINNCTDKEKTKLLKVALSYQKVNFRLSDFTQLIKHNEFLFLLKYPILKSLNFFGIGK
jgi:glycosyltransferase involved in cell wall biosynthesis